MKILTTSLALCAALVSSGANAALESRLGGLAVYDTDLNITWLADANYAKTETFGININADGSMNWNTAQSWIGAMNTANYLGYNDWRLPTTLQPDVTCGAQFFGTSSHGYNCTGSEMGHLFYSEFGGMAGSYITSTHNANYGLFKNVQSLYYWSGTEYAYGGVPANDAWAFLLDFGAQGYTNKFNGFYALAVRPGDVASVPVPAAVWLLGSGLLGLIGVARRKTV